MSGANAGDPKCGRCGDTDGLPCSLEGCENKRPEQGAFLGRRVEVCFDFDTSRIIGGDVIRDDAEAPGLMLIHLDDGRVVRSVECQYSFPRAASAKVKH